MQVSFSKNGKISKFFRKGGNCMFAILVTLSCFLAGLFCLVLNYFRIILILRIDIFVCGWIVLTLLPALVSIIYHERKKLLAERIARIDEEMDQGLSLIHI